MASRGPPTEQALEAEFDPPVAIPKIRNLHKGRNRGDTFVHDQEFAAKLVPRNAGRVVVDLSASHTYFGGALRTTLFNMSSIS